MPRAALLLLGVFLGLGSVEGQTLVIGGFPSVAPWAVVDRRGDQEVVVGGLIKDIADRITAKTGIRFSFYFPPRKRMEDEIANGRLDVLPSALPTWLENPGVLKWSRPLFTESMVFVSLAGSSHRVVRGADLKGLVVGTLSGYVYPELTGLPFLREDTATIARNLHKLEAGRIDLIYGSSLEIAYRLKPNPALFRVEPWVPVRNDLQWAMAKRLGPVADRVLKALDEMQQTGEVEAILTAYR